MTVDKSALEAAKAKAAEAEQQAMLDQEHARAVAEKREEWREKAVTWAPHRDDEHPKEIWGILVDGSWVSTQHGPRQVLTVQDSEDEDRIWTVWISGTVLESAFSHALPRIGALIGIKFGGKQKSTKPGGYDWNMWFFHSDAKDFDQEYWTASRKRMEKYIADKQAEAMGGGEAYAADGLEDPYG